MHSSVSSCRSPDQGLNCPPWRIGVTNQLTYPAREKTSITSFTCDLASSQRKLSICNKAELISEYADMCTAPAYLDSAPHSQDSCQQPAPKGQLTEAQHFLLKPSGGEEFTVDQLRTLRPNSIINAIFYVYQLA